MAAAHWDKNPTTGLATFVMGVSLPSLHPIQTKSRLTLRHSGLQDLRGLSRCSAWNAKAELWPKFPSVMHQRQRNGFQMWAGSPRGRGHPFHMELPNTACLYPRELPFAAFPDLALGENGQAKKKKSDGILVWKWRSKNPEDSMWDVRNCEAIPERWHQSKFHCVWGAILPELQLKDQSWKVTGRSQSFSFPSK